MPRIGAWASDVGGVEGWRGGGEAGGWGYGSFRFGIPKHARFGTGR